MCLFSVLLHRCLWHWYRYLSLKFINRMVSVETRNETTQRETLAPLGIGSRVTHTNQRVGDEPPVQVERVTYHFWTEERGAHPACIQAEIVGHQQHILYGCPQALNCHRRLIGL